MVRDFINAMNITDGDDEIMLETIGQCAYETGAEDFFCPVSNDTISILPDYIVNRRLSPLVNAMLDLVENTGYYGLKTRTSVAMLKEYYGIGRRPSRIEQIAKRHGYSCYTVSEMIKNRGRFFVYSDRFTPWQYLFMAAMFLRENDYRDFLSSICNGKSSENCLVLLRRQLRKII